VKLLVGKWQFVALDGKPYPNTFVHTLVFSNDGSVTFRIEKSREGTRRPRFGKFQLNGDTIWLETKATKEVRAQSWAVNIEMISEDKLVLVAGDPQQRSDLIRVKNE